MSKKTILKKVLGKYGGKGGPLSDSPWWSRFGNMMGSVGKTPQEKQKSRRDRTMELMDINREHWRRQDENEWRKSNKWRA